jgi:hypothetical protein
VAEEVYAVAFDIQDAGANYGSISFSKTGAGKEASFPPVTQETGSLQTADGLTGRVAICKLVEVTAGSAAEACEAVRLNFGGTAGKMRAAVKPNTNFKSVTP